MIDNCFSKKLFITLITILLQTTFLSANSIRFISVDYPTVTRLSSEQNKFFFVNFSAKWCPTCTVMEETANANAELVEYIHNNFIAVKADVDGIIGKEWQNKYEVTCLPTLIIFSSDGQEITRIGGGLTASEFLLILKSIEDENPSYASQDLNENNQGENVRENGFPKQNTFSNQNGLTTKGNISNNNGNGRGNTPSNNLTNESNSTSPNELNPSANENSKNVELEIVIETNATSTFNSNSRINTSPSTASKENNSEYFTHLSQNTTNKAGENNLNSHSSGVFNSTTSTQNNTDNFSSNGTSNNTSANNNVASNGYNSTTNKHNSNSTTNVATRNNCSRFGVQVGMYANEDNANRKTKRMKRSLSQPIFIQQQIVKGQLLYQVVVGEYLDLQEAIRFQKRLTSKGIKGYLVQR